ncbi:MAG: PIN domain-containing protein [Candidatus Symbiothrix sp.]|jgi:predicted nucleic acid-binding protein|nr:PIN domain-containing protein [Candidatus Symbiothrix sp.]
MNDNIAVDTNILLYAHYADEPVKTKIALEIIDSMPLISSQVISEYMNVLKRQFKLSKEAVIEICIVNFNGSPFHSTTFETIKLAKTLIDKYDFQLFDSVVVASALESNCSILYSEDMQNGIIIEKQLKIINPFLAKRFR